MFSQSLCEINSFYFNCLVIQDNQCIRCKNGYYLDEFQCKPLQLKNKEMCLLSYSPNHCVECHKYYYFKEGEGCMYQGVDFCEELEEPQKCKKCVYPKVLDINTKQCIDINNEIKQNCQTYKNSEECLGCREGYSL